jgi:hypothetical protein
LVLLCQLQQVLAAAVAVVAAGVSGALLVGALALRQPSTVAAFAQHRLSEVRTLPAEVLVDQASHRDSMMVVLACLPSGRRDSLAQSVDPQRNMSAGPLQLLGNQTA